MSYRMIEIQPSPVGTLLVSAIVPAVETAGYYQSVAWGDFSLTLLDHLGPEECIYAAVNSPGGIAARQSALDTSMLKML